MTVTLIICHNIIEMFTLVNLTPITKMTIFNSFGLVHLILLFNKMLFIKIL